MTIESYVGIDGVAINIESEQELYEAIDLLHTQVMDNLGEDHKALKMLSDFLDELINNFDSIDI